MQRDFPASVYEVVLSGCLNSRGLRPGFGPEEKKRALGNMSLLNISDLKNKSFQDLSGGQRQRVLLARSLCATKRLLLLDEPATGLDPVATEEFYGVLDNLNKKHAITIIMVSHDIREAVEHADHILHLSHSGYFFGTTKDYGKSSFGKNFWEVWQMLEYIGEMFSYPFMQRAFLVGILVSLCASLLGVSLVLKRYSMIGDGLSHVGFGALAVASALHMAPLAVAVPVVILAAFVLLRLSDSGRLKGDAAIAMISTGALAVGVMVVSVTTGMNSDLNSYMFGSILAMSKSDVVLSAVLSVIVLVLYLFFYDKIFAVTFDTVFARATGIRTGLYNMLLAVLTAVTVVLGMRMMGALLISSLIIFPALTAMRVCKCYRSVILCSVALSVISFVLGMTVSFLLATPAGASIVIVDIVLYVIFWAAGAVRGR